MCNDLLRHDTKKPVIAGIIAEYNPLHNGHVYHIQKTRELLNPDYVLCIMSGNFTQRGEPASVRKQVRTECALRAGIDCVIELPFVYATSSAEFFAGAGVSLLNSIGCVTHISFGCETPDLDTLNKIAHVLAEEPKEYTEELKEYLDKGYGFPVAREKALRNVLPDVPIDVVSGSNNILALEYMKQLMKLQSPIKPLPILREGASYTELGIEHRFSSAMGIRHQIETTQVIPKSIEDLVPEYTFSLLKKEFEEHRCPLDLDKLNDFFQIYLRSLSPRQLIQYPFMEPGLENRLKKALERSSNVSEIIQYTVSKRYPATRIKRLLLNILSGITQHEFDRFVKKPVPYVRILGFNEKKPELIGLIKRYANIPVITKTSDLAVLNDDECKELFEIEARTTDIYRYLYPGLQNPDASEYKYRIIKI